MVTKARIRAPEVRAGEPWNLEPSDENTEAPDPNLDENPQNSWFHWFMLVLGLGITSGVPK